MSKIKDSAFSQDFKHPLVWAKPSYFKAALLSFMVFSPTSGLNPDKSLLNDIRYYIRQYFTGKKQLFQILGSVQNSNKIKW